MQQKTTWKKLLGVFLNLIIGINFLLSAYAKLPSIEVFGWTIAESTPFSWTLSEWIARLLIGLEIFLGLLFVLQIFIKKIALPFATFLLVLFSVYLLYVLKVYGNEANCGCYGELIPLSTIESLTKNGVLILLILFAYKFRFQFSFRFQKLLAFLLFAGSFTLPIVLSPPANIIIFENEKTKTQIIPLHLISQEANYLQDKKKIVAFVSPTCKYCKKAAKRMGIIKKRHPEVPFQFVMAGHRDHLQAFWDETNAQDIPLIFIDSTNQFMMLNARTAVPTIKWLDDSTVVKTSTYFSLSEDEILDWLKD